MITHLNSDNHHQLRGRIKVITSDAPDDFEHDGAIDEQIEINLASSSSYSLLSTRSASSSVLWNGGGATATSPPLSPIGTVTAAPSSPSHRLGIWTSTTPRPTDEEYLHDDEDDDDDNEDDDDDAHDENEHNGDNAVFSSDVAEPCGAVASISDEVMLSRTGSVNSLASAPTSRSFLDSQNDGTDNNKEGHDENNQWDLQIFQSASSCCAAAATEEEDEENGVDREIVEATETTRDAVQDILQSASSLLFQAVETAAAVAAASASGSPMGIECLPIVLGDAPVPSWHLADEVDLTASNNASRPTTPAAQEIVSIESHQVTSSSAPSTPHPLDPNDDDGSSAEDESDANDSPISRYRKEAEARLKRDAADSNGEHQQLLSARIAAAAVTTPVTTMATPIPSLYAGLPPPPPQLSSLMTTLPPSVRVPLYSNSATATPISNMSPLSLDSSSHLRYLGTAAHRFPSSSSQPATPVLPFSGDEDDEDDVRGDDSAPLSRRKQRRRQHLQELRYLDDMMLLPPTPHDDDDNNSGVGEIEEDANDRDGVGGDGAGTKAGVVASQGPFQQAPPPPPPPPPPPLGTRSGPSRGGGRRLHLRRNNRPDLGGGEEGKHEPNEPPPPPAEKPSSQKRHDDVSRSLVDADEEEDDVDDETAADDDNDDNEVADLAMADEERRIQGRESDSDDKELGDYRQSDATERRDPSSGSTGKTTETNFTSKHGRRMQPMPLDWEEKKEALELPTLRENDNVVNRNDVDEDDGNKPDRLRANSPPVQYHFASERDPPLSNRRPRYMATRSASTGDMVPLDFEKTLSMTESDVGSLDGLPSSLKSRWGTDFSRSEREALQRIDGVSSVVAKKSLRRAPTPDATSATLRPFKGESSSHSAASRAAVRPPSVTNNPSELPLKPAESFSFFSNWPLKLLWGEHEDNDASKEPNEQAPGLTNAACCRQEGEEDGMRSRFRWKNEDDSLALLACANLIHHRPAPTAPTTLIRVSNDAPLLSFCQTYNPSHENRMPAWVEHQFRTRDKSTKDGQFLLGTSRAVIVHEIVRGNWTWATAWSPDGSHLAVATENHHMAVLDTRSSTVWRVRHDKKLQGPVKQGTTHSIRSIAWGKDFIAIGGTGNAVSIISPMEPYAVLQTIPNCGFVGSLDWRPNSNDLVIGSRLDRAMIVRVRTTTTTPTPGPCSGTIDAINSLFPQVSVLCETIYTVERKHWVNAVAYSHSGRYLAIGDAGGTLLVYDIHEADLLKNEAPMDESKELVGLIKSFALDDAILAVEWSPDGCWLYAGGEDFAVSVIDTEHWEIVHKIKRDRWVQCIAASRSGTHVAVGGVSSEVSLLETKNGWDSVMGMELNGLVPLSAKWHPRDQFLSLTGQNNSILVVETTNARHVRGHHLHSVGGILAVEFSPDGRMAAVGNESGVVTIYSLSGSSFVTSYELVVMVENDRLSIQWSRNGLFVVIATRDSMLIVGRKRRDRYGKAIPPKCSGFSIRKVVKDLNGCNDVSIDLQSQYVAVAGSKGASILDVSRDFAVIREWPSGPCYAAAWSPLGRWLATIGKDKVLTIYDTGEERVDRWRPVFSVTCDYVGRALAWGPLLVGGLLYLAYAGDGNEINVMEIRTQEGTWETILRIQRPGAIHALDWHVDGLLAAALSNGTVSIVDLAYLQSGVAVNEMDYNWQRQALTSFTEIRRNRGSNLMRAVRWIPSAPGSDTLLAVGGSDGELEIVDLTERQRCRGYAQ